MGKSTAAAAVDPTEDLLILSLISKMDMEKVTEDVVSLKDRRKEKAHKENCSNFSPNDDGSEPPSCV